MLKFSRLLSVLLVTVYNVIVGFCSNEMVIKSVVVKYLCHYIPNPSIILSQRSTEQMRKIPTIVLSITYKGVKFIDAANKVMTSSSSVVRPGQADKQPLVKLKPLWLMGHLCGGEGGGAVFSSRHMTDKLRLIE